MSEPAPPSPEVLQRKLERERRARLEAETIAEKTTLELYKLAEARDAILRSAGDGILACDAAGKITMVNPAGISLLGRPDEDLLSETLHFAVHRPRPDASECTPYSCRLLRALRDSKTLTDVEETVWRYDGRPVPTNMTLTAVMQSDQPSGFVLTIRDVSARKQAEEARVKMMSQLEELKRLQELDGLKTNFINMAAHELRTPLTPIRTELFILRQSAGEMPADQRKSVDILARNFDRLARLVEDVLEGSRLQAGRLGVQKSAMDLTATVTDVVDSYKSVAAERAITLDARIDPSIPIMGDAARLAQVMVNLISNASKFTPEGGTIAIGAKRSSDLATVTVKDTGVGLTREDMAKLFRPFSQVGDHSKALVEGTGLGLFICKGIIELHGGRIWVDSPGPGKGTTFSFAIPVASLTAPKMAAPEARK